MKPNYYSLYNITYKKGLVLYLIIILSIISIFLASIIKIYSTFNTLGIYDGKNIIVDIPTINSDILKKCKYIKINDTKTKLKIFDISTLKVSDDINYQSYTLEVEDKYQENEIVNVTFYYNRQRIIEKIIHIIF